MSEISKLDQNLIIKKIDNETININISDNEMLMSIVGQFDQNLKELAKLTSTKIFFRGNSITCKGKKDDIKLFCESIKFLSNKYFLTKIIEKEDIMLSVKKNIELYDHETIVDKSNNRLIGFGYYAGVIGAYNGFRTYGLKKNLFVIPKAIELKDRFEFNQTLKQIKIPNIKILLSGKGRVGSGTKEVLDFFAETKKNCF